MGPDSPIDSEPYNFENFVCVTDDKADDQVELDEQEREKPKDQGEEPVKVTLASTDEEPRPIFMISNLLAELKQAVLALLESLRMRSRGLYYRDSL